MPFFDDLELHGTRSRREDVVADSKARLQAHYNDAQTLGGKTLGGAGGSADEVPHKVPRSS